MELKNKLIKPYTEEERNNFLVEQNHKLVYKIVETEEALEAWGDTEEEKEEKRRAAFDINFFETSLGYVRRSVSMRDGSFKDFISGILPGIETAFNNGLEVKIITYDKPPFDKDIEDWTKYQHHVIVTQNFISECLMQLQADFGIVTVASLED